MDTLPGDAGPARCLGDGGAEGTAGCRGQREPGSKKLQLERQAVKVKSLDQIIAALAREKVTPVSSHSTLNTSPVASCVVLAINSQGDGLPYSHVGTSCSERHESLFRLTRSFPLDGMVLLF